LKRRRLPGDVSIIAGRERLRACERLRRAGEAAGRQGMQNVMVTHALMTNPGGPSGW